LVNTFPLQRPSRHIRLVCYHNQKESRRPQERERCRYIGHDLDLAQFDRWERLAVANYSTVDDTIPIQKNRSPRYRVDSHFVGATFSAG
jgi:hypothetical protein